MFAYLVASCYSGGTMFPVGPQPRRTSSPQGLIPRTGRATSWLLVGLYLVTAAFGWSLHAFLPCGHDGCGSGCHHVDVADTACGCGGHSCALPTVIEDRTPPPHDAIVTHPENGGPRHDPHHCAVCSLLANLKVGHAVAPPALLIATHTVPGRIEYSPLAIPTPLTGLSARGPPIFG